MKKMLILVISGLLLWGMLPLPAGAETFYGDDSWNVAYNGSGMVSSFVSSDIEDVVRRVKPGDAAIIYITLKNDSPNTSHWYMDSEILRSLEAGQSDPENAYGYTLTYAGPSGTIRWFFDSDAAEGDGINHDDKVLRQTPDGLEDCFYLGELSAGETGTVTLGVWLGSETQGSTYRDNLAKLQMVFQVEENLFSSAIPKTGDSNRILLFSLINIVSGLLLLSISLVSWRKKAQTP